jgi:hypothetical protein
MSTTPALRRETHALWSLHHTLGFGLRKFKSRVGRAHDAVIGLAMATSREIAGAIARHSLQPEAEKAPHAKWPDWRPRSAGRANEDCMNHSLGEHLAQLKATVESTPPSRMLKAHASDESTVLGEQVLPYCESVEDSCSNTGSLGGSTEPTAPKSQTSGRPGRRQKARRRQLEWEEASRASHLEAICESSMSPSHGDSSWALGALTSVFESLVEDDCEGVGLDEFGIGAPPYKAACKAGNDFEDEYGWQDWQHQLRSEEFLEAHARALSHVPAAVKDSYCEYRQAALDAKLDTVISLKRSIISIEPCVRSLE